MFGFSGPTPYDLRFSIFGIPVFVNPMFWAIAAFMGWGVVTTPGIGPYLLLIWIACLFVSILIHELGHAIFAKAFGWPPQIFLYHMGGLAVYQPYSGHTTGKSIAISFAGPAAGFVLYAIVLVCEWFIYFSPDPLIHKWEFMQVADPYIWFTVMQLKWINLYWGLVNLLPVLPLDGGRICEALCEQFNKHKGKQWAAIIGMVFAGIAALLFFQMRQRYAGFLFAYLCYINFTNYQRAKQGYW